VCGLCGVVALGRPPEVETAERMARELDHRGPDGDGLFHAGGVALGFRRLAIIDLSEAGRQPFASEDGRLQLVHNGEVYNYRELRRELEARGHRFRSATDTEVILAAYREWGERCVERFNGMWAFALWDGERQRLLCSRDRFGVKPFYYRYDRGRFVFASELKAFRADPETRLAPNRRAVREYLEQGYVDHTDETFFSGIVRLPPAHSLTLDADGLRLWRYWRLEPRDPPERDPAAAVRELFFDSVRLRLRSDVPIGTCLSGGIDSSSIACAVDHLLRTEAEAAKPIGEGQRTFTAYFDEPGFDERPYAEAVVERTGASPRWISFTDADLVDSLPAIVETQDEPFGSTSIVAQWYVMREARRAGLKVMLDGQGADEIFAGYHGYFGPFFADLLVRGRLGDLRRELGAYRTVHGASAARTAVALARPFVPERARWLARGHVRGGASLVHADLRGLAPSAAANGSPYGDRLRRQLHLILTRRGLPELLRYEDRNSMAHSLEARVPFLDYRLVELLFSLESRELIEQGKTKVVLRRALGDLLPPAVRDRVDKLGFVTPEARWLRGRLGALAADVFASRPFAERGFVDATAARRRLERHRRGELQAGFELWRALNVELWARTFLDGRPT
jgi:asparagine synthase (glutamine-hydrolysing)